MSSKIVKEYYGRVMSRCNNDLERIDVGKMYWTYLQMELDAEDSPKALPAAYIKTPEELDGDGSLSELHEDAIARLEGEVEQYRATHDVSELEHSLAANRQILFVLQSAKRIRAERMLRDGAYQRERP